MGGMKHVVVVAVAVLAAQAMCNALSPFAKRLGGERRCVCPANECNFRPEEYRYECPNGYIMDDCGCVTSCQCADCPPVNRTLACPGGRKTDHNGCPLNECKECICPANECGFFLPPQYRYECPNGNVKDTCGCVTSCQCDGCPAFQEILSCPFGRKVNADGCPLNECEQPPSLLTKPGICPRHVSHRSTQCTYDTDCRGAQKCCSRHNSNRSYCSNPHLIPLR